MVKNTRLRLWLHLVSEHAAIIDPFTTHSDLKDLHRHEHDGPGTMRDHQESDRTFALKAVGAVLSEAEGPAICLICGMNPADAGNRGSMIYACDRCGLEICSSCSSTVGGFQGGPARLFCSPCVQKTNAVVVD